MFIQLRSTTSREIGCWRNMTNNRVTWEEMVKKYPDKWVVKDAEMNGSDIMSGVIVAAMTDDEITEYRLNNSDYDLEFCRTT